MPQFADVAAQRALTTRPTSVATPSTHLDEVTLRFRRYTPFGGTAYQRDQVAGFLLEAAKELVREGRADVIDPATGAILPIDVSEPLPDFEPEGRTLPAMASAMAEWFTRRKL